MVNGLAKKYLEIVDINLKLGQDINTLLKALQVYEGLNLSQVFGS